MVDLPGQVIKKWLRNKQTPRTQQQIATAYYIGDNFSMLHIPNMPA